jgi:hypothetical protein
MRLNQFHEEALTIPIFTVVPDKCYSSFESIRFHHPIHCHGNECFGHRIHKVTEQRREIWNLAFDIHVQTDKTFLEVPRAQLCCSLQRLVKDLAQTDRLLTSSHHFPFAEDPNRA